MLMKRTYDGESTIVEVDYNLGCAIIEYYKVHDVVTYLMFNGWLRSETLTDLGGRLEELRTQIKDSGVFLHKYHWRSNWEVIEY